MAARKPFLSLWCYSLLLMLVCSISQAFAQQENQVLLRSIRGSFHPFVLSENWSVNRGEIINKSSENKGLVIGGVSGDPRLGKLEFARTFSVPPMSARQIDFSFRSGMFENALAGKKNGKGRPSARQTYALSSAATGQQLGLSTSLLIPLKKNVTRISVFQGDSTQRDSVSYLRKGGVGSFSNVQFVSSGNISNIPNRWYAYSMLDMILMSNYKLDVITPAQLRAIEAWVRNGGTLMLVGGKGFEEMIQSPLGQLAGVVCLGNHMTDTLAVKNETIKLDDPTWFGELCVTDAEVLMRNGQLPMLTLRSVGKGRIIVLASNMISAKPVAGKSYDVWSLVRSEMQKTTLLDTSLFSSTIIRRERVAVKGKAKPVKKAKPGTRKHKRSPARKTRTKVKETIIVPGYDTLQAIAGKKAMDRYMPVGIMAGFAGFTILMGALLRLRRRGEILWMILIPLAVLAGFGAYYVGRSMGNPQRLTNVGVITGLGNSTASVQQYYAYYSGPESQKIDFGSGSEVATVLPAGKSDMAGVKKTNIFTNDTQMVLPDLRVKPNKTTAFFTSSIEDFNAMETDLRFNASGLGGVITNELSQTISDAVLFVNGVSLRIGNLKPGRNVVKLTNIDQLGKGEFTSSLVQQDTKWNELIGNMITAGGFNSHVDISKPVVIGYIPGSMTKTIKTDGVSLQGRSVLVWPIKYEVSAKGKDVNIPFAFMDVEYRNPGSPVWNMKTREFNSSHRPGKLMVLAGSPEAVGRMKNVSAKVSFSIQAQEYDAKLYWAKVNPKDRRGRKAIRGKLIKTFSRPTGEYTVELNDIDSRLDGQGRVVLLMQVTKTKQNIIQEQAKSLNVLGGGGGVATWKLVDFSVSMKGTVK